MSIYEDEDGIDGPFERALRRAELGDAKAAARVLGRKAFERGAQCAPALDAACLRLCNGLAVGGGAAAICRAWTEGWTEANLAAEPPQRAINIKPLSAEGIAAGELVGSWPQEPAFVEQPEGRAGRDERGYRLMPEIEPEIVGPEG